MAILNTLQYTISTRHHKRNPDSDKRLFSRIDFGKKYVEIQEQHSEDSLLNLGIDIKPVLKQSMELAQAVENNSNDEKLLNQNNGLKNIQANTQQVENDRVSQCFQDMENARAGLQSIILNQPFALPYFSEEYFSQIEKDINVSDLFSVLNEQDPHSPVQDLIPVHVGHKQLNGQIHSILHSFRFDEEGKDRRKNQMTEINKHIRLLPVFVHSVIERMLKQSDLSHSDQEKIRQRLSLMISARKLLIEDNIRLAAYVAKQYKSHKLSFADLIQEGTIGLIKAVDRFDCQRSVKFSTYAIYWIRQSITRALTMQEKTVRLPYNLAVKVGFVYEAVNSFMQINGSWPDNRELAKSCQLSEEEIQNILNFSQSCIPIDTSAKDDDEFSIIDTLEQTHFSSPFSTVSNQAMQAELQVAIANLPEREANVIRARFGLNDCVEMTLQELAEQLKVSRERVRQIQNSALKKIRTVYGQDLSDFLMPDSS